MAEHIILTKAQADAVRGKSTPTAALEPIEMADGTFALPAAVLADPAHARALAALRTRPRRQVAAADAKWAADAVARGEMTVEARR